MTRKLVGWLVLVAAAAVAFGAGRAAAADTADDVAIARIDQPHTKVLIFPAGPPGAGEGQVSLALVFRPQAGWHVYWRNPGDSGLPPKVRLLDDAPVELGPLSFPVPERIPVGPLMNYGYEGEAAFFLPLRVPAGGPTGVSLRLDWLVCAEVCVPESGVVTLSAQALSGPIPAALAQRLRAWRARLPQALPAGRAEAAFTPGDFALRVALPGVSDAAVDDAYFYPGGEGVLAYAEPQRWRIRDGALLLAAPRDLANPPPADAVEGLLVITRRDGGEEGFELKAPLVLDPAPVVAALKDAGGAGGHSPGRDGTPVKAPGFGLAFALAVLGGLILNLMPCVFPVLSMKAMALLRSSAVGARTARRDGLFYSLGVILGFLGLAAVLLVLKQAGEAVGWGFQLQEPWVVALLAVVMFLVGAHFIGWWRLPGGWSLTGSLAGEGAQHSLFTGLLAAVVATPCTAPFMATAIGAAVVMPTLPALGVFAGLGVGLSLPYLLVTTVPGLRRLLPRSGPWMERLQQALAFPMWLTAVWLVWVLARLAGETAAAWLLAGLVMLGFALWCGRSLVRSRLWAGLGLAAAAGFVWLAAVGGPQAAGDHPRGVGGVPAAGADSEASLPGEQPFSRATVAAAREKGRPVFVYFTADWCITCKVNEAIAFTNDHVRRALAARNVAVFRADWTHRDSEIAAELTRFGRDGVPLYLFYPAGADAPRILPQVLTPEDMLSLLEGGTQAPSLAAAG